VETNRERFEYLARTLADEDVEYDFTPERIASMKREKAELERDLERESSAGMT
jgi:hypothetical protein